MMTPQMLERATPGYRSGYNDAVRRMPNDPTHGGVHPIGLFWNKDYADGYKAGQFELDYLQRSLKAQADKMISDGIISSPEARKVTINTLSRVVCTNKLAKAY